MTMRAWSAVGVMACGVSAMAMAIPHEAQDRANPKPQVRSTTTTTSSQPQPRAMRAIPQDREHRSSAAASAQPRAGLTGGLAVPMSTGYYRIPYADGTKVRVSRDHNLHTPKGRYDMSGQGGGPYKIVAAARGRIVAIEDGFSAQQDSDTAPQCENNYVWILHPNGEVSKYSHMRQGTTTGAAGLKVGDTVKGGQYLGDEGAVGCAGGSHLHFEIGDPASGSNWFTTVGGFLTDNANSNRNRIARICGISNGMFASGQTYTAASEPDMIASGSAEVARHGLAIGDYQCFYNQALLGGYEPEWLDMFDSGGKTYVNAIFRPKSAGAIAAYHGLNGAQYQARFTEWTGKGYRPIIVESYLEGGSPRYAAVFKKSGGPATSAYHGVSAAAHQQKFDQLSAQGYVPRAVSVISSGGLKYTALYEKGGGSFQLKSQLTIAEYQEAFNANRAAGRHVAYLNGYTHGGQAYIAAIFGAGTPAGGKQRHGLTGGQYQSEYQSARNAGMLTRVVTGYGTGNGARYAASWRP